MKRYLFTKGWILTEYHKLEGNLALTKPKSVKKQETQVWSLGQEVHLRRAWQPNPIFLTGEFHGQRSLGRLQSNGSQRVGHDWETNTFTFLVYLIRSWWHLHQLFCSIFSLLFSLLSSFLPSFPPSFLYTLQGVLALQNWEKFTDISQIPLFPHINSFLRYQQHQQNFIFFF